MFSAFEHDKKATSRSVNFIHMHELGNLRPHEEVLNEEFKVILSDFAK